MALTAAPLAPARPLAPGLPCREMNMLSDSLMMELPIKFTLFLKEKKTKKKNNNFILTGGPAGPTAPLGPGSPLPP